MNELDYLDTAASDQYWIDPLIKKSEQESVGLISNSVFLAFFVSLAKFPFE